MPLLQAFSDRPVVRLSVDSDEKVPRIKRTGLARASRLSNDEVESEAKPENKRAQASVSTGTASKQAIRTATLTKDTSRGVTSTSSSEVYVNRIPLTVKSSNSKTNAQRAALSKSASFNRSNSSKSHSSKANTPKRPHRSSTSSDENVDLAAMLAAHNQKFRQVDYEPRKHSGNFSILLKGYVSAIK